MGMRLHIKIMFIKMFIIQCNGKDILWKHLEELYEEDTSEEARMRFIPKLKYEHIHLTSFSKMRVGLVAQVRIIYLLHKLLCYVHV